MRRPLAVSLLTLLSLAACDRGGTPAKTEDAGKTAANEPAKADAAKADADKGDAAKPDAAKPDAAKPDAAKPDAGKGDAAKPSAALKPNEFKAPTREEAAEKKKALQQHLDAGRKHVTEKNYELGIAELEKAIAINPLHAKSLGELGWAYFNAGKLDEAKDRLERGLQYAESDGTRGAILYNLGRVAEAKGDKPHAIELYGRSLAVRPNDVVSKRLADLGAPAPAPTEAGAVAIASTHSQCSFAKKNVPWGNLCWGQLGELGVDVNDPSDESQYGCGYGQTTLDAPGGAISAGGEISVYELTLEEGKVQATVFSYYDLEMFDETFMLAVVVDGVLYTSQLAWVSHPGVGYADENVESVKVSSEDVVPGGRPELVIEWSIGGHDLDPGIEEEEFWSSDQVAYVSLDGGAPQWLAALTLASERTRGPMTSWEDGNDTPPPVAAPTEKDAGAVTIDTSGGKLTVTAQGEASAPVGSFAFSEYPQRCPNELF